MRPSASATLAIAATAFALAWTMQGPNGVQNAHHALVRALASGTTAIDTELAHVGEASTNDVSVYRGHTYSNKAPGLALVCVPLFAVLDALGAADDPTRTLWALGLVGCVLPAVGLVLLVRRAGDRLAPGFGIAAGVALALGTIVLPFGALFLSHVLSAFLVFAAFVVLWLGPPRALSAAGAGVLAGYAVTTEYPNALAVAALGLYLLVRGPRVHRALAYTAGAVVGVVPLLAYQWAAFDSPFRVSYRASDVPIPDQFGDPSLHVAMQLVLGFPGLVPLSPVVAAGAAGLVLAWRRGFRAEAAFATGFALAYVSYNAAFYSPFGGSSAGPRYLITILPFVVAPFALVFRRFPLTSGALTIVSVAVMTLLTATYVTAGYDGRWLERLQEGQVTLTAASLVGVTGAVAIVPFFAAGAAALALAFYALPRTTPLPTDMAFAAAVLAAWAVIAASAPDGEAASELANYLPALLALTALAGLGTYASRAR